MGPRVLSFTKYANWIEDWVFVLRLNPMGAISEKEKVVLVAAVLRQDTEESGLLLEEELEKLWGPIRQRSASIDFDFSNYYEKEMGASLKRQFVGFSNYVPAEMLADAKVKSNALERRLSIEGNRRFNIDPGYLAFSKVVVASTKDATYRVYLGKRIYAQPMLLYEEGSYHPWPWTYPDYRCKTAISFFNSVRSDYKKRLRR
jgi:hypothetical protein